MRCVVILLSVSLFFLTGAAYAQECPECVPIDNWFAENGDACFYHGNRIPSVCDYDPECLEWNRRCAEKRDALNACIHRCMSGTIVPPPPPAVESEAAELDMFDRVLGDMAVIGYDENAEQQTPDWCQRERQRLAQLDPNRLFQGRIGYIARADGVARVRLCVSGRMVDADRLTPIRVGDCVETDTDGRLIVQMVGTSAYPPSGRAPNMFVGTNSKVCFDQYYIPKRDEPEPIDLSFIKRDTGLLNMLYGEVRIMLRKLTRNWKRHSIFDVRAGPTITGVRGSEVIVRIEPSDGSVQVGVIEGEAWVGNRESREYRELKAGDWAQDTVNGLGPVQHLTRAEWNNVLAQDGLDLEAAPFTQSEIACALAVGSWQGTTGNIVALEPGGRWTITNGSGFGSWSCSLNSSGVPEVLVTPDIGGWWIKVVIAPDGMSFAGNTDTGAPTDAVRVSD